MSQLQPDFQRWDQMIRSGLSAPVRKELAVLLPRLLRLSLYDKKEREWRLEFARLSRRTGSPQWVTQLLAPVVRPRPRQPVHSTEAERAEYGAGLVQIGARREGIEILSEIDPEKVPQSLLFQAFAHFSQWDYDLAIKPLAHYVTSPQLTDYERLVGELNYAAALVSCDREEAIPLLERLLSSARASSLQLMEANALELLAQALLKTNEVDEARKTLGRAQELAREVTTLDSLYIDKWQTVANCEEHGLTTASRASLKHLRERALLANDSETVREIDFHQARFSNHRPLWRYVYFGTPYASYRRRIREISGQSFDGSYTWRLRATQATRQNANSEAHLDILTGANSCRDGRLKVGQIQQRLLAFLCNDFYRRPRVAEIYASLFSDRYYNPSSSPTVVHQAILRLRHWLREQKVPLHIQENSGTYYLLTTSHCDLSIPRSPFEVSSPSPASKNKDTIYPQFGDPQFSDPQSGWRLQQLKQAFQSREFSAQEAARTWELPDRSARRLLQNLVTTNTIAKLSAGPQTRYCLK